MISNIDPMSNDYSGFRPFRYQNRVFRTDMSHTHVGIDSDGEIHTFTEQPDAQLYNDQIVECGYWNPANGETRFVGTCQLEGDDWLMSCELIDWNQGTRDEHC